MDKFVYLAGPMTGTTFVECMGWRYRTRDKLDESGITALIPGRGEEVSMRREEIISSYHEAPLVLETAESIRSRDYYDVANCNIVLVNMLGAKRVSIGTVMEIGWATALDKLVCLVMEKTGNPHDHPHITKSVDWWVDNLEDGITVVKNLLEPYVGLVWPISYNEEERRFI